MSPGDRVTILTGPQAGEYIVMDPPPRHIAEGREMMRKAMALAMLSLTSCSTTVFDPATGHPALRIQSDASRVAYTRSADGAVTFSADTLSNSAPVLAAGKALTPAVMAASSVGMMNAVPKTVNAVRKPIP